MLVIDELQKLQSFAEIGKRFKNTDLEHLDAPMGAFNYIRMVNFIADHIRNNWHSLGGAHLPFLDWGAGYGQITWLLKNRGVNVTGYNIEEREHVDHIPELAELPMVCHQDPVKLPFEKESFAGVSSCGVLEHVSDPAGSLKEIHRILKPGGYFYLFMLPQKTSWVEKLSEWRGCSVHPVRYTMSQTEKLLTDAGFEVEKLWKFNLVPKNLTGLPQRAKRLYGKFYRFFYPLDEILSKIPLLNLLSGVIEGIAHRKPLAYPGIEKNQHSTHTLPASDPNACRVSPGESCSTR